MVAEKSLSGHFNARKLSSGASDGGTDEFLELPRRPGIARRQQMKPREMREAARLRRECPLVFRRNGACELSAFHVDNGQYFVRR